VLPPTNKIRNQIAHSRVVDTFVLFVDPNAANTTAGLTVKLTKPIQDGTFNTIHPPPVR